VGRGGVGPTPHTPPETCVHTVTPCLQSTVVPAAGSSLLYNIRGEGSKIKKGKKKYKKWKSNVKVLPWKHKSKQEMG